MDDFQHIPQMLDWIEIWGIGGQSNTLNSWSVRAWRKQMKRVVTTESLAKARTTRGKREWEIWQCQIKEQFLE